MKTLEYQFLYDNQKISPELLLDFLEAFEPEFIPKQMLGEGREFDEDSKLEILKLNIRYQGLYIEGENNSVFSLGTIYQNRLNPRAYFSTIHLNNLLDIIRTEFLYKLINTDGFKIGFLLNKSYNFTQSVDNPQRYIPDYDPNNFPYSLYFNEDVQTELIDISQNPGRERFLPGMKFIPAFKIWFGKEAQDLYGKEQILKYPYAMCSKELESGIIEMQFMDDIMNCDMPYNQEKQRDIVKYLGVDKMEVSKY